MNIFAVAPNWRDPVVEGIGYVTDVMTAYDDNEQRVRLRETANGALAYRATCVHARNAAQMQAFLTAKQAEIIHVPWWPDAQPLQAAVIATDTVLAVDTTNRDFTVGKRVILWRDQFNYETAVIATMSASSITLTAGLAAGFPAGTDVVPLKPCRLEYQQRVTQPTTDIAEMDVSFTAEAGETPEYEGDEPTQYQGMDLLEVVPNNAPDFEAEYLRSAVLLDNRTGIRVSDDHSEIATTRRGFQWWAKGRASTAALKAFVHRRQGRAVPFWLPSYRRDLPLYEAVAAGVTFDIQSVGYTEFQFPFASRRHIAFITPAGALTLRAVEYAVDNADGTETLTVSSALPELPASTLCSFLLLMRLDADDVEIAWSTRAFAEAQIPVIELPREVPE